MQAAVQTTDPDPGKFYFSNTLLLAYYEYASYNSPTSILLGKRKWDATVALLQYLERSEKRFLEQIRRHQDLTTAMLQKIQRTDGNSNTLVGLMGRMVSVLE